MISVLLMQISFNGPGLAFQFRSFNSVYGGHQQLKIIFCTSKMCPTEAKTEENNENRTGSRKVEAHTCQIITEIVNRIVSHPPRSLVNFIPPEELEKQLEELLSQNNEHRNGISSSSQNGSDIKSTTTTTELCEIVQLVLERCITTSHPMFVSQMYGGVNPIGMIAPFIVEKMNTNQHTYEAAPVFVLTESIILRKLRLLFYGTEDGDGIFAPGGSFANMYGMTIARNELFPEIKQVGLWGLPPLVVFTSEEAHYSVCKMGNWMGLGLDNIVTIKTGKNGAMLVSELEQAVTKSKAEGKRPYIVVTTAGTTVLGAFDPLDEISEVCKREGMWLHCDASWGGSFIFSEKLKMRWLSGIEKCDSLCWNAHKMLGAPLQCSVFLTKHSNVLSKCNSISAPYLFQSDKHYSTKYDVSGAKSVQCGRKADAFKLWLMWSVMGTNGFRDTIENTEDCARYFTEKIRNREGFLLYLDYHQCTNVFFWYVPPEMRNCDRNEEWWEKIASIARKIKTEMLLSNTLMIGYAPLPHKNVPDAFRLVLTAYPEKTHTDMDFIIDQIEKVGLSLSGA